MDSLGKVAVEDAVSTSWRAKHLRGASGNIFEVEWNPPVGEGGGHAEGPWFPVVDNGTCSTAGCEYVSDWGGNCLCDIQINNTVVFVETGLNTSLPSAAELRAALFIGASDLERQASGILSAHLTGALLSLTLRCTPWAHQLRHPQHWIQTLSLSLVTPPVDGRLLSFYEISSQQCLLEAD